MPWYGRVPAVQPQPEQPGEQLVAEADREQRRGPSPSRRGQQRPQRGHLRVVGRRRVARSGAGDHQVGGARRRARCPGGDPVTAQAERPELVGEHAGEGVLGVDDQRRPPGQRRHGERVRAARASSQNRARCALRAASAPVPPGRRRAGRPAAAAAPAPAPGRARRGPRRPWRASRPPRRPAWSAGPAWRRPAPAARRPAVISAVRIRIGASSVCRPAVVVRRAAPARRRSSRRPRRSCRAITRQAFSIGLPVTVGANIVSRSTSRTSSDAAAGQQVLGVRQVRHLLEVRPDHLPAVLGDGGHHLQLLVEHHVELVGLLRVGQEAQQVGRRRRGRNVPLIGFIITRPSSTLTCRSGVAPTSVRAPVCTRNVQYAPRSSSSSRRSAASAARQRVAVDLGRRTPGG